MFALGATKQLSKDRTFYFFMFAILFVFSAIRFQVGYDYPMYYQVALDLPGSDYQYNRFEIFNKIIMGIGYFLNYPFVYFIVSSFIIVSLFANSIYKYSIYPALSVLMLFGYPHFFLDSFSFIRQWIAMAVCLYSLKFILSKNFLKYLLCVIVAVLFHKSALLFLIAYPLVYFKISKVKTIGFIAFSLLFGKFILGFLMHFDLPYVNYLILAKGAGGTKFAYLNIMVLLWLMYFKPYFDKDSEKESSEYNLFYNFFLLGTTMSLVLIEFGHVAFRTSVYFVMVGIFILPNTLSKIKQKKYLYFIFGVVFLGMLLLNLQVGAKASKNLFMPYKTILFLDH